MAEKRLIDANALKSKLEERINVYIDAFGSYSKMPTIDKVTVDIINTCIAGVVNAPTVDAVEVVRCKGCGYWKYVEDGYGECSHPRFHLDGHHDPTMEMNGFCSCGERREGE